MRLRRVMKGEQVTDYSIIKWPKYGSFKIDGFRAVVSDIARTSGMKEFPNRHVHNSFKGLLPPGVTLDGELVVGKRKGPGVLNRTSSGITSEDGIPDWNFWVFDAPRLGVAWIDRVRLAKRLVKDLRHPQIRMVKHVLIEDLDQMLLFLRTSLDHGFEGIILDDPDAEYKQGKFTLRQQGRMKIKPFISCEARITDYYEEMENTNEAKTDLTGRSRRSSAKAGKKGKGTLGGLIGLDTVTGEPVRCGSGISDALRKELWSRRHELPGGFFTYEKQAVGEKNKPRHATFKAIRPAWDLDSEG